MSYLNALQENDYTVIHNLKEIAHSLDIEEEVIIKYLSLEFNTEYFKKDKKYYLKGNYTFSFVNDTFNKFVEKYLDCPKCGKTNLYYGFKGDFCKSCKYSCDYSKYITIETEFDEFFYAKCLERMFKY
jgi:hypothetical protein